MELKVTRRLNSEKSCIGELYIDGEFFCNTLEDRVREEGVKVQGQTAIPAGRYKVIADWSNRFQKIMPHILAVPGFEGIRIHCGNSDKDTSGCLLLGLYTGEDNFISQSRDTFYNFKEKILGQENVFITLENELKKG